MPADLAAPQSTAGIAERCPFVERIRDATDRDLAVHHRAAAEALAAPVEAGLLSGDSTRQKMRPLPFLLEFALMDVQGAAFWIGQVQAVARILLQYYFVFVPDGDPEGLRIIDRMNRTA